MRSKNLILLFRGVNCGRRNPWGLEEAREAICLMSSLSDLAVMQSNWLALVVNVKRGYLTGAETVRSNEWSANVEQRGDPGIRGTGTTRAVTPN